MIRKNTPNKIRDMVRPVLLPIMTVVAAIGNPVFFMIMLFIQGKSGMSQTISDLFWSNHTDINGMRLWNVNSWLFYTVLVYSCWLLIYVHTLNYFRKINKILLIEEKLAIACVINIPMLIKAYAWTHFGLGDDIISFAFMLLLSLSLLLLMSLALFIRYALGVYDMANHTPARKRFLYGSILIILLVYSYPPIYNEIHAWIQS